MMKCKKGLVAGVVAVCMMGAMGVNAFAADEAITGATEETTRKTTLSYKVDQSYTWTVPSAITFTSNELTQTSEVSVSNNVIGEGKVLRITITGNGGNEAFSIKNKGDNNTHTLKYSVKNGTSDVTSGDSVLEVKAGNNTGKATLNFSLTKDPVETAGEYEGTVTYTANVVTPDAE